MSYIRIKKRTEACVIQLFKLYFMLLQNLYSKWVQVSHILLYLEIQRPKNVKVYKKQSDTPSVSTSGY